MHKALRKWKTCYQPSRTVVMLEGALCWTGKIEKWWKWCSESCWWWHPSFTYYLFPKWGLCVWHPNCRGRSSCRHQTSEMQEAPSPDGIQSEHLKYGGEMITQPLTWVLNCILDLETILQTFKHSIIVPVHKRKGCDPLSCGSYRGISLVSALAKVMDWHQQLQIPRGKSACAAKPGTLETSR